MSGLIAGDRAWLHRRGHGQSPGEFGGDAELALNPPHVANREPGGDTGISLSVANIEETYQSLVDKGVTFTKPLEAMPWGTKATWLNDPDGNTFFFTEG